MVGSFHLMASRATIYSYTCVIMCVRIVRAGCPPVAVYSSGGRTLTASVRGPPVAVYSSSGRTLTASVRGPPSGRLTLSI